jgi:N6-L-threonylcarbamoyladenine synthase
MTSNLATGLNTAKGLAAAWDVPLLGVNHMQAHALTPRLVSALEKGKTLGEEHWKPVKTKKVAQPEDHEPAFPFLSLLVSGGHTLLVHSQSLTDHQILAQAMNIAIGDMIDKCARIIIPASHLSSMENVMYGPLLEKFAFPSVQSPEDYDYHPPPKRADEIKVFDSGRGWSLTPPLSGTSAMTYDFAGFNSQVQRTVEDNPDMSLDDRRFLAKHAMRLAFEHLVSRLLFVLKNNPQYEDIKTVVVAGGVASNKFLMHVLKKMLEVRGFGHMIITAPPPALCTDNAAMIAWTGMEMYEAGWRSNMDMLAMRKWPVDPRAEGGGIVGAQGWSNVNQM